MAAIAGAIAFVVITAGYLYLCLLAVVFFGVPGALVGFALAVVAGVLTTLYHSLAVLTAQLPAPLHTPADVAAGRLPGRVKAVHVRRDRAWPQYFVVQVRLDLQAAAGTSLGVVDRLWSTAGRLLRVRESLDFLFFWPVLLPVLAVLLGYTGGVVAGLAAITVVAAAVSAVAWAAGLVAVALLRAADRAWQLAVNAKGTCPRCYARTHLPAYQCPGPHRDDARRRGDDLHRDIRPGRLGVLWRHCACGRRLPTTVLRAAPLLEARCPVCTEPLHEGAAVATDVRIPVFGAASAGKTHLVMAGLVSLLRDVVTRPGTSEICLADEHSKRTYREYLALVESGQPAPKTNAGQQPVAVTVRLPGRPTTLVHLFDAAGEALADPDQNSRFAYLDYARTLAFVLDPFSIPDIRHQLAHTFAPVFREANAATHDPESSYQVTATRLRDYGVNTRRQRLAFVVSKADLLFRLPVYRGLGPDASSDTVRGWLVARGLDNLVTAAERDFGEVRFFLISAKNLASGGAAAPFRWLLETERVALPQPVRAS